jgi:prepilin-type N-terminal cleavage/methylation domain-containing protein
MFPKLLVYLLAHKDGRSLGASYHSGRRTMRKRVSGFTLIELVLVLFLVGIIAVFAYPALESAIDESRYIQCESQLEAIRRAKSLYVVDHLGKGSPENQAQRDVFECYFVHPVNKWCPRVGQSYSGSEYEDPYDVYKVAYCPFCRTNIPDGVREYAGQQ